MNRFLVSVLFGVVFFLVSCEKEDFSDDKAPAVKAATINTQVYTLSSEDNKGFSVEFLQMADASKVKADFIIIPQTGLTGDVISPFLSHPNFERRFVLSKEFDDAKSAEAYFDSYNVSPDGEPLQQFALNLRANQVWLVKTREGSFCKLLILETKTDKESDIVAIKFKAEKIV